MMSIDAVFAIISGVLVCFAGPPYLLDILHGKTKPQRMTWFILGGLGVIAFVSQLLAGASWSLVFSGLDTLGSVAIFFLSLWRGTGGADRLDIIALCIAVVGAVFSIVAHQPLIAIVGVIVADIAGMSLTLVKVWRIPKSETFVSWFLFATAGVFGVLAIPRWTWAIALYPCYLVVANYSVPFIQLVRGRRHTEKV